MVPGRASERRRTVEGDHSPQQRISRPRSAGAPGSRVAPSGLDDDVLRELASVAKDATNEGRTPRAASIEGSSV